MSRKSRKTARQTLNLLLIATTVTAVCILMILAIKMFAPPPQQVDGSTDTNTVTITSNRGTSDTGSETDSKTTDSHTTDSSTTDSKPTDTKTDSSTSSKNSNTNQTTDTQSGASDWVDDHPGINADGSFDFTSWNLILANPDNALPENFSPTLKTVTLNGYKATLDARIIEPYTKMINDAKKDGITLISRSTYRGIKEQSGYFYARIEQYKKQGMTAEQAWAKTATIIAVPGTSEHHTGLAADITTPSYNQLDAGYEKTAAAKWLKEHCHEYGFILRYPKDKKDITKIIFEPWHFRYVGTDAAQIIMSEGICYEEFVERYGNQ